VKVNAHVPPLKVKLRVPCPPYQGSCAVLAYTADRASSSAFWPNDPAAWQIPTNAIAPQTASAAAPDPDLFISIIPVLESAAPCSPCNGDE
jgi:hypothetical protein